MTSSTVQKPKVLQRHHDYLYDSAFIVTGAKDYARAAFKAAMASAQLIIQPVYKSMFSDYSRYPRHRFVYYPNCRLPNHMDTSYEAYLRRREEAKQMPNYDLIGKERFKFNAMPKNMTPMALSSVTPDFQPTFPVESRVLSAPGKPRNRGTQSKYRETSAQTIPWQPDYFISDKCKNRPEVLYLDDLKWGPGKPYRNGDLPADFHTTEIINKKRHARVWMEIIEKGTLPRFMSKRDDIIEAVETKDWVFREAEIDELQTIRLEIMHRIKEKYRESQATRTSTKLTKRWDNVKKDMQDKISKIRYARDRELRKLAAQQNVGGKIGMANQIRATRGGGSVTAAATDPGSNMYAPLLRNGYQASCRNAVIYYDPSLIVLEDHEEISKLPPWLLNCGRDLKKTCSGHYQPPNPHILCERETKWSEAFLARLHDELKKARLGAAESTGQLHVLKPRRLVETPRPPTPTVEPVPNDIENYHQAALLMQKYIKGRAVQNLMYEGRTRASELTQELKSTHGLQKEDKWRIAQEEAKAREYTLRRRKAEEMDDMIAALMAEVCGDAVSSALDFLEKELRRLKEERRHHAFILIALREKAMREAAEAGRRQKEERRRREHDEMFKQILGYTQQTVEQYLRNVIEEGVELGAETDGAARAQQQADIYDYLHKNQSFSTAEENELVAELVHQFLLPEAHKAAARQRLAAVQQARLDAVRDALFGVISVPYSTVPCASEPWMEMRCTKCGLYKHLCTKECGDKPAETKHRDDPRWKLVRKVPVNEPTMAERYPPSFDIRNMLNVLVDEVVAMSREERKLKQEVERDVREELQEKLNAKLEARMLVEMMVDIAVGAIELPLKQPASRFYTRRVIADALNREFKKDECLCPKELPSELRRRAIEEAQNADPACRCPPEPEQEPFETTYITDEFGKEEEIKTPIERPKRVPKDVCRCPHEKGAPLRRFVLDTMTAEERAHLLPSELRELEEIRKCKCVTEVPTSSSVSSEYEEDEESLIQLPESESERDD